MTKTSLKSHRSRCRDRLLKGTPVAFVLTLLLAACQGPGSPDTLAPGKNVEQLMHVADDTRANGDLGTAVDLYRRAAEMAAADPRPLLALGSSCQICPSRPSSPVASTSRRPSVFSNAAGSPETPGPRETQLDHSR